MPKSAIILGATGLTGNLLLQTLLKDDRYEHISLFSRSTCGITHIKLTEYLVDLFQLKQYKDTFVADEVFCCIGTTKAKTSNMKTYTDIDYGIPVMAASLCKENSIETFVVISALGAKKNSKIFYNRIKGSMEVAVLALKLKHTYILQPSLISGERTEKRLGESIMKIVMSILEPILKLGDLEKYQLIHPQIIANCMVWIANHDFPSGRITSKTIQEIGKRNDRN